MEVQDLSSFKLRALLRQLRSRFLEVLKTPDFRTCKAAHEIRKDMELLLKLYKQMVLEASKPVSQVFPEIRSSKPGFRPKKEGRKWKNQKPVQPIGFALKAPKKEAIGRVSVKESYIIGGSALGWNFITFLGSKPVYYGVTKKTFRRRQKVKIH